MARQIWTTALGTCLGILMAGVVSMVLALVLTVALGLTVPTRASSAQQPDTTFDLTADPTYPKDGGK